MAHQKPNDCRVRALAILAIRHGRELGEQVAGMRRAPVGDLPRSSLGALLRRLEAGEVTDGRDLTALEALHAGLTERLTQEIVGSRVEPRLVGYDEDGEIWSTMEVPVYSNCGEEARSAYEHLERFLEVRQQFLDHAKAERLAMQILH